jgi:hypothetical protein
LDLLGVQQGRFSDLASSTPMMMSGIINKISDMWKTIILPTNPSFFL